MELSASHNIASRLVEQSDVHGERTAIMVQISPDCGEVWSSPVEAASTADASDHPLLAAKNGRPYLSWLTAREGYRLLPLSAAADR